ncbi:hypothetical protein IscW_ISCW018222 [Ixodes scapularis]|uniref:Uncharacterized protein n=1 Tax=Ixodes scapularis TaxID=6945 RepID=B7PJD1_IXOSC|nr:hypothetical protein IscW_ISCW018222 [Ixodes scapularis]|eukprot:XP_002407599.1 hypothetical protein IscW_ISCW018222 [Ixodes scapularis]
MRVFLVALLFQRIVRKPEQEWYWSKNKLLQTPFFGQAEEGEQYPPGTIVSAICEWIVVLTFLAFSLSFAAEFRKFKLCLRLEYRDVDGGAAPLPVKPDASPEKPEARD